MDRDDNIDDLLRLQRRVEFLDGPGSAVRRQRVTLTWQRSRNGVESWRNWKSYTFQFNNSDEVVVPSFGFAAGTRRHAQRRRCPASVSLPVLIQPVPVKNTIQISPRLW
jgi:hypothetical protein